MKPQVTNNVILNLLCSGNQPKWFDKELEEVLGIPKENPVYKIVSLMQSENNLSLLELSSNEEIWIGLDLLLAEPEEYDTLVECYRELGSFQEIVDFIDDQLSQIGSLELIRKLSHGLGSLKMVLEGDFTYIGDNESEVYNLLFEDYLDTQPQEMTHDPFVKSLIRFIWDDYKLFVKWLGLDENLININISGVTYYFREC